MCTAFRCASIFCFLGTMISLSPAVSGPIDLFDLGPYQVIRPVSVDLLGPNGESLSQIRGLADGSGLTTESPLTSEHSGDVRQMWSGSIESSGDPLTVQFDLGNNFNISEFWVWQYGEEGETDRGVSLFDVVFKNDQGDVVGDMPAQELERVTSGRAIEPSYFCPYVECVRFIEFRLLGNFGDLDIMGLSEVAFAGRLKNTLVPEPLSSPVALVTICLCFLFNQRNRQNR